MATSAIGRSMSPVAEFVPARVRHENHSEGTLAEGGLGGFLSVPPPISPTSKLSLPSPNKMDRVGQLLNHTHVSDTARAALEAGGLSIDSTSSTVYYHEGQGPEGPVKNRVSPLKILGPKGHIEKAGGLASWEMTNAPVHVVKAHTEHFEGALEGATGGVFGYLAQLQKEALSPPSDIPPSPSDRRKIRFQDGELTRNGIGKFIANEDNKASSRSKSPASPTGLRHHHPGVSTQGTGAFDAYGLGDGLYKYVSDKGDPPKPHLHVPTEMERLGIKHPGVVGEAASDPHRLPHIRTLQSQRGEFAHTTGGFSGHMMTPDADSHRGFSRPDDSNEKLGVDTSLRDPIFQNTSLSPNTGGIGGYSLDQDKQLVPPSEEYLSVFPGQKFARKKPIHVVGKRDMAGDAVAELLREEEAEEALARDLADLDARLGRAGLAATRRAPIGEAGVVVAAAGGSSSTNTATNNMSPNSAIRKHHMSNRWHEEREHFHVKLGTASPAAAAITSAGRIPLDGVRLAHVRSALRHSLPKDANSALLSLRHKLNAKDGDADGILTDEEVLRTLIDLAPSSISASDVGYIARFLREYNTTKSGPGGAQAAADAGAEDSPHVIPRSHLMNGHKRGGVGGEGDEWEQQEEEEDGRVAVDEGKMRENNNAGGVKSGASSRNTFLQAASHDNDDAESVPIVIESRDGSSKGSNNNNNSRMRRNDGGNYNNKKLSSDDGVHENDGVKVEAMLSWLLGMEGGRDSQTPRQPANDVARLMSDSSSNVPSSSTVVVAGDESARLDFASKSSSYVQFRAAWEKKHGDAARKEAALDAAEPQSGATWTRTNPMPFKVVHMASPPPTTRMVSVAYETNRLDGARN